MILKRKSAFTLIEAIIAIFIFSILLVGMLAALATARNSWKSGGSQMTVQQEARKGLNAMLRELRQAGLSTITGVPADGADYNSITFQIPSSITASGTTWSTNIQYSIGGLNSSQLLRTQDSSQRVLANNISALTFSRNASTPDVIDIDIATQKNTFPGFSAIQSSINLNSEVKIRND